MANVRVFYWHDRIKSRQNIWFNRYWKRKSSSWRDFIVGNAGDIFARNLVQHFYQGAKALNVSDGPRLLCVGSIAHKLAPGDILCGIGCKSGELPSVPPGTIRVHGLRGPITEDALKTAGYDTSQIQWHGDPGLTISKMIEPKPATPGRVIFIPHYRERETARDLLPKGIKLVDIDDDPLTVGRKIMEAELVYSSSLHGIVFAHALGRPVVMVKPATEEPLLKFEDYFLGVGLQKPEYLGSISDAQFNAAPNSPATLSVAANDITFPSEKELRTRGIMT